MPDASAALESARACSLGPAVLCSVKAMHDQRRTGANRRSILDTGALLRMGARRFGICIQKCACQGTTLLCGAAVCTLTAPCPCKKPSPRPDQIGSAPTALCPLPSACHLFSWPQSSRLSDLFTPFSAPVQLCILYVLLVWTLTPHHLITENS
jgi:hypothetical protein